MKIVVTTPTGNIGGALTEALLDRGEKPVLIARKPERLKDFTRRGAKVAEGSHADADVLIKATADADSLFVLVPTNPKTEDIRGHYRRFANAAAQAIERNAIPRVVFLSSVGADKQSGTGPVVGLYEGEQIIGKVAKNLVNLRPGYFMENTLGQIPSILHANALFTTFPKGTRFPMIATRDIGASAADYLSNVDWAGQQVVELQGPGDISYDEIASVLSETLGRDINHVTVSRDQQLDALMNMGISRTLANSFGELADAIVSGHVRFNEPRSNESTTPTAYPVFAKEVFKPAFEQAARKQG